MAASVKCKWTLKKCAKFLFEKDLNKFELQNEFREDLDFFCKGAWKLYSGENNDLILSYLESDHFLITKKDVILESFSLLCCKSNVRGVAKADSLLMSINLQDGNKRQFRIQFDAEDGEDGITKRKQCTNMLHKFITILDFDEGTAEDVRGNQVTNIDNFLLDKMQCRKGYLIDIPKENLKQILALCLTDNTFPAYVAEVDKMLKDIGKNDAPSKDKK